MRSLHSYYSGLTRETIMDPAFDRPEIVISGITFQNGEDEYHSGGLVIEAYNYAVTVKDCIIKNNSSDSGIGGGLSIIAPFNLTIENNQILGNILRPQWISWGTPENPQEGWDCRGGGLSVRDAWNGYLIRNNIVADNVAEGSSSKGGGMWLPSLCSSPIPGSLINNTICRNSAWQGGGLHFSDIPLGRFNLYNNIIRSNNANSGDGSDDLFFAAPPDLSENWLPTFSLFNNNYSRALGTSAYSGDNMDEDPRFVDPDHQNYHLAADSPMRDRGRNAVPDPPGLPEYDYEGQARVNGDVVDIGADEYHRAMPLKRKRHAILRIWCNGRHGAVLVKPASMVKMMISLVANDDKGKPSKVFIIMSSAAGRYFLSKKRWTQKRAIYYDGPLKDIPPTDLPIPLPLTEKGTYTFWFGVEFEDRLEITAIGKRSLLVQLSDTVICHPLIRTRKLR
jgi:hypothetical protein